MFTGNSTRVATTATTVIKVGYAEVSALLAAGAATATLQIYDTNNTTPTASRKSTVVAVANTTENSGPFWIRCQTACTVTLTPNTAVAYISVR